MARMIPPLIDPGCKSPGERELFRRLRDDPGTRDWIILHSLDVARHIRNVSGEADFIVIVPEKGVLVIEVKAHSHIACKDGLWYLGRNDEPEARSPFRQASDAMHSIRTYLAERRADLSHIVFWSAVIFTNVPFTIESEEWHRWQVIDAPMLRARPISELLVHVLDNAREWVSQHRSSWFRSYTYEPNPAQCLAIADTLRPRFEMFESPRAQAHRRQEEVRRYTEEQFAALDALQANPRVAFVGPAGTGKTMLAIEAARRAAAAGRCTLFVCYNAMLARWLERETASLRPQVVSGTLHAHMLRVAGIAPRPGNTAFWTGELPDRVMERLLEAPDDAYLFDELVIDEAQDILRNNYLDVLDLSLRGGLASGRWRLFGDFEKQSIYGTLELPVEQMLQERCGQVPPIYALWVNCRNTPRIASLANLLGGLEPGYSHVLRPDDHVEPTFLHYASASEQQRQLAVALSMLEDEGFRADDIAILSPRRDTASAAAHLLEATWAGRVRPLEAAAGGQIRYCSIHAFKGLEAPAVVVTDIEHVDDPSDLSLFYVATTRALHRLVILVHDTVRQGLMDRIMG